MQSKIQLHTIERSTLTVEEVAKYISVSTDMIYKMVREKAVPHFRIGRRILFRRSAIDEWISKMIEESMKDDEY